MKKFYSIVMILFAVSVVFAQQKPIFTVTPLPMDPVKIAEQMNAKSVESGWYNYAQGMAFYMYGENYMQYQSDLIKGWPMLADRVGIFPYSDKPQAPQISNFAQVFEFNRSRYWTELYETLGDDIPVPGTGSAWGVDSVCFFVHYSRGTEVPADVVDTIIVSYAVGMDQEKVYYLGEHYMSLFIPCMDLNTYTFDASKFDHATVINDRIELDTTFECGDKFYVMNFAAPEALKNIEGKVLGVSFTYRAATENRTAESEMGKDMNRFQALCFCDPRQEYQTTAWGSYELLNNLNSSLYTGEQTFAPNDDKNTWHGMFMPTLFWTVDHLRPYIGLHINCTDCRVTDKIGNVEKSSINVYPNPATSTLSVELVNNTKANVQLFNLVGQVVMSEQINGQDIVTLNVNNLKAGVYMLRVDQDNQVYTSKVIVR